MRISDWSSDVCSSDLYKQAIVDAADTGTVMLNRSGTPCVRALKTGRSLALYAAGSMDRAELKTVQQLYFGGDMEASVGPIGRASCRERVCQYVYISVVAVSLKNKTRYHESIS